MCCSISLQQQTGVVMVQNNPNTNTIVITQTTSHGQQQQTYPAQGAPPPVYSQEAVPPGQYPMAEPIPPKVG